MAGAQAQVPADKLVEDAKKGVENFFKTHSKVNYNLKVIRDLFDALKKAGRIDPSIKTAEDWYKSPSVFGHGNAVNKDEFWKKIGQILAQAAPPATAAPPTTAPPGMAGVAAATRAAAAGVKTAVPAKQPPKPVIAQAPPPAGPVTAPPPPVVVQPKAPPKQAPPTAPPATMPAYRASDFLPPKFAAMGDRVAKNIVQPITIMDLEMAKIAISTSKFEDSQKRRAVARIDELIRDARRPRLPPALATKYDLYSRFVDAIYILVDAKDELENHKSDSKYKGGGINAYKAINDTLDTLLRKPETEVDARRNAVYYLRYFIPANAALNRFTTPRIARWRFKELAETPVRNLELGIVSVQPGQNAGAVTLRELVPIARDAINQSGLQTERSDLYEIVNKMIIEAERLAASTDPAELGTTTHFVRRLYVSVIHAISLHELKLALDNRVLVSPSRITPTSPEYQNADKVNKFSELLFKREFGNPKQKMQGIPEIPNDIVLEALHNISSPVVVAVENAYTDWMAKRMLEQKGGEAPPPTMDYSDFEQAMLAAFTFFKEKPNAFRSWEARMSLKTERTAALQMLEEVYAMGAGPFAPSHLKLSADTALLQDRRGGDIYFYLREKSGKSFWKREDERIRNSGSLTPTVDPAPLLQAWNLMLRVFSEINPEGLDVERQIVAIRKTYANRPIVRDQKINDLRIAETTKIEALKTKYREAAEIGRTALRVMLTEALARYTLTPYNRNNPDAVRICDTTQKRIDAARDVRDGRGFMSEKQALDLLRGVPPLPTGAGAAGARGPTTMPAQVVAEAPFIIRPKVQIMNAIDPKNRFVRVIDYEVISEGKTYSLGEFTRNTGRRTLNPAIDLNFGFVVYLQTNLDPQNPMYVASPGFRLGRSTNPYIGIKQGDKVILTQQKGNLSHVPVEEGTVLFNLVPGTTYPVQDALWEKNKGLVMIDSGTGKIANLPWTNIADARAVVDLIKEWKAGEVLTGPGPQPPPPPPPPAFCPIPR